MANKHRGVPRVYPRVDELIKQGLPNLEVLAVIRKEFPQHRTSAEQIRFRRQSLRVRFKNIPSSVEARRRRKAARTKD
jgi:hypothetical protein